MLDISLIAAVDEHFGLGKDNQLLCHLPADLKHFKQITFGKSIIMGRNTFLSIGKPLPGRQNIVLSQHMKAIEGVEVASSLQQALCLADHRQEIIIIGGGAVFQQALPMANRIYLTVIHHRFTADVFFPPLDILRWRCVDAQHKQRDEKNSYDMTFYCYEREPAHPKN